MSGDLGLPENIDRYSVNGVKADYLCSGGDPSPATPVDNPQLGDQFDHPRY